MDHLASVLELSFRGFPSCLGDLQVGELVKDAVTAEDDKIIVVLYLEAFNIWCCNNDLWVASVFCPFGFDVSEGARD